MEHDGTKTTNSKRSIIFSVRSRRFRGDWLNAPDPAGSKRDRFENTKPHKARQTRTIADSLIIAYAFTMLHQTFAGKRCMMMYVSEIAFADFAISSPASGWASHHQSYQPVPDCWRVWWTTSLPSVARASWLPWWPWWYKNGGPTPVRPSCPSSGQVCRPSAELASTLDR